ncbi:hypothetical protein [Achromobacter aloeverae]
MPGPLGVGLLHVSPRLPDPQAALARLARAGIVATILEYGYLRLPVGAYNDTRDIENILRAAASLR